MAFTSKLHERARVSTSNTNCMLVIVGLNWPMRAISGRREKRLIRNTPNTTNNGRYRASVSATPLHLTLRSFPNSVSRHRDFVILDATWLYFDINPSVIPLLLFIYTRSLFPLFLSQSDQPNDDFTTNFASFLSSQPDGSIRSHPSDNICTKK
jgi:hypothetical protein